MDDRLIIAGGKKLSGEIKVQGSKNAVLPILSACVLTTEETVIHNCPNLSDVEAAINILIHLGCKVSRFDDTIVVDSSMINNSDIPDTLMHEMRSSVVFLGAVLGRMNQVSFSLPGGCEIGLRPIDIHLFAVKKLGALIYDKCPGLLATAKNGLFGNEIILPFASVGATENAILAASTAKGITTIINAAREPEITDLASFLNACGAKIHNAGEGTIIIEGVSKLSGCEYSVIPDRIVAATYMTAAAVTNSDVLLTDVIPFHLGPVLPIFSDSGCDVLISGRNLRIKSPKNLSRIGDIKTMPYPGFPTDIQAPVMSMATICDGTCTITENIFESRFKHVGELLRMGAKIKIEGRMAVIEGVPNLYGTDVFAFDLRGGAALVVAGLCASGITTVSEVHHIDRGHENIEMSLQKLGAEIRRETNGSTKEGTKKL